MRDAFDRLLRDLTLVTLALAIALGWSLIQVAEGVAGLFAGLLYEIDGNDGGPNFFAPYALTRWGGVLTWDVGGRVLSLGPLVAGLVQLGVVLAVAVFVYRRARTDAKDSAQPS
ncbi:MAG TPA: hypothetical protein VFU84_11945 [Gaiellaceae bacterium]|nr:hypothetical protein [Gaiellaceae bacterium]